MKVTHRENEDIDKMVEAKEERKWAPEREGLVRSLRLAHEEKTLQTLLTFTESMNTMGKEGASSDMSPPNWPLTNDQMEASCISLCKYPQELC